MNHREIISVGLIFIKPEEKRVLLVQNKSTHASGCIYSPGTAPEYYHFDSNFADNLTMQEKEDLINDGDGKKYKEKIRHMYSNIIKKNPSFVNECMLYYANVMYAIRDMLKVSYEKKISGSLPWSFPKGRATKKEKNIDEKNVAIREVAQEIGVTNDMYRILNIEPIIISYCDHKIRYKFVLYYALPLENFETKISDEHEINDIKWMSKKDFSEYTLDKITRDHIMGNFDKIFLHYNTQISKKNSTENISPRTVASRNARSSLDMNWRIKRTL